MQTTVYSWAPPSRAGNRLALSLVARHRRAAFAGGYLRAAALARYWAIATLSYLARRYYRTCRRFAGQCVGYSTLDLAAGCYGRDGETALFELQRAGLVAYRSALQPLRLPRRPDPVGCFWSRFPA